LTGDLRVGDFTSLPWPDASADLVIDRCSLTCVGRASAKAAVAEVARILRPGGRFFCNPYSRAHTSCSSGHDGPDDLTTDIAAGTLTGVGSLRFYDEDRLRDLFAPPWQFMSLQHVEVTDRLEGEGSVHAEWRAIVTRHGAA